MSSKPTAARWAGLGTAFVAAVLALSSPADASCQFPAGSTDTPGRVAKLLFSDSDALGFAVVRQAQNLSSDRAEEIEMIFPLKGPPGNLRMRNPAVGASISITNAETTFLAPAGTLVFAALKQTKSGWVIGECTTQLLNAFPLAALMPELRREFLSKRKSEPRVRM